MTHAAHARTLPVLMKITRKSITSAVETVLENYCCRRATVYLDESTVVSCTARRPFDARLRSHAYVLKIGKPNFVERRFIRLCKQAGEPLPVRKVQLKFWPKK